MGSTTTAPNNLEPRYPVICRLEARHHLFFFFLFNSILAFSSLEVELSLERLQLPFEAIIRIDEISLLPHMHRSIIQSHTEFNH